MYTNVISQAIKIDLKIAMNYEEEAYTYSVRPTTFQYIKYSP